MRFNCRTLRRLITTLLCLAIIALYLVNRSKTVVPRKDKRTRVCESSIQNYIANTPFTHMSRKKLPNLHKIHWPEVEFTPLPVGSKGVKLTLFGPKYSAGQYQVQEKLLNYFIKFMERHGLSDQWFIYAGALLGSFRHHGLIPWDDDVDILINNDVRKIIWENFPIQNNLYFLAKSGRRDKIHAELISPPNNTRDIEGSRKLFKYKWGWPYLDLTYYVPNSTHIIVTAKESSRYLVFRNADVFPLVFRPYNKRWVPAPRNPLNFIKSEYPGISNCAESFYSHAFERGKKKMTINCDKLAKRYYFVRRFLLCPRKGRTRNRNDLDWILEQLVREINSPNIEVLHEILVIGPRAEANVNVHSLASRKTKFNFKQKISPFRSSEE